MDLILLLCYILDDWLNLVIVVLGGYCLARMIIAGIKLASARKRIDCLLNEGKKVNRKFWKREKGKVLSELSVNNELDVIDKLDSFREDYQKKKIPFDTYSLSIQVFPLLGILGTVAGLYIAMNENTNVGMAALYDGVGFALTSTVLGIIAAVLLKFVEIIITARCTNYIDESIDRYMVKYQVANDKAQEGNQSNEA